METISIEIKGGIGNIMFQIATAYSTSLKNNMNLIVDITNYYGSHYNLDNYKNNILKNIKFSKNIITTPVYEEKEFKFNELPKFEKSVKLSGYFQSEKYFKNYRKEILELFSPTEEILSNINKNYLSILNKDTTSIHVRRGDYLHLENFHPTQKENYYRNAITHLNNNTLYLIFSDDINWCKNNFDFIENKIFIDNLEDFEELYLMSMCKNNIIANSSFSWWGAWMNKNENKKIISPATWFGKSLHYHDISDIYGTNWIKI
jgi:hypothetical protein